MNKEIAETITHKIDLLRVSATLSKEYQSRLDTLEEKAIILSDGDLLKGYNKSQINAKLKAIDDEINAIFNELGDDYEELQEDIADSENDFLMWLFGISALSLGNLKDIVKNANADGFTAKQATQKQAFDLRYELSGTIRNAWITAVLNKKALDEKLPDTADLIKKQFKKIKNRIGLTVTNTIDTVAENVRYQFIMHNKKMNTLIHISVLDNQTSSICTARNGCMWDKDTKDGINTILPFELPPLHPHCRSHIYGINADEKTPNAVFTGEEWVKSRSLEDLQEQFGKQAGKLLHNGDITLNQAIDRYGVKRLTLEQMRQKIPVQSVQSFDFERKFEQLKTYAEKVEEKTKGLKGKAKEQAELKARDIVKGWKSWQLGTLSDEAKTLLGAKTNKLTLSADTLVKQLLHHKDITAYDYRKAIDLINNAEKAISSDNKIMLFKQDGEKWYQIVIKVLSENNYCVSLFKTSEKKMNKALVKTEKI